MPTNSGVSTSIMGSERFMDPAEPTIPGADLQEFENDTALLCHEYVPLAQSNGPRLPDTETLRLWAINLKQAPRRLDSMKTHLLTYFQERTAASTPHHSNPRSPHKSNSHQVAWVQHLVLMGKPRGETSIFTIRTGTATAKYTQLVLLGSWPTVLRLLVWSYSLHLV